LALSVHPDDLNRHAMARTLVARKRCRARSVRCRARSVRCRGDLHSCKRKLMPALPVCLD